MDIISSSIIRIINNIYRDITKNETINNNFKKYEDKIIKKINIFIYISIGLYFLIFISLIIIILLLYKILY
jgi:hypothetical protein